MRRIFIVVFIIICQLISVPQDFDGLVLTDDKVVLRFMEVD